MRNPASGAPPVAAHPGGNGLPRMFQPVQLAVQLAPESNPMDTITYSEARARFAKTLDKVCDDRAPVVITRRNAESVVMMSLDDYHAFEETAYLLRSPKNARRLLQSIAELESGAGTEKELLE